MEAGTVKEKLLQEGWNLNSTALDLMTGSGLSDVKAICQKLLDIDLRTISEGTLPEDINKTKYESIPGGIILQIQKVKNLSTPKYHENQNQNSTIMKFVLSDGVLSVQGVGLTTIQALHVNTLPGTKIFLTGEVEINHCFLLLSKENTIVLGGRVEQLIEKWELNRKLAKHKRDSQEEGGPPPWIPFGQKIAKPVLTDKNFKSLDQGKTKENTENAEFEAQRKGAILEASKIGVVKVFGGGNNKLLDHNVQIIIEAGYTEEQAEYALKHSKNNPDRALKNLQSRAPKPSKEDGALAGSGKPAKTEEKSSGKGKGRGRHREDESTASLKPSGKVSLFDFLEDKLPASEKDTSTPLDTRNNKDKQPIKNYKVGIEKTRSYGEEKKNSLERADGKSGRRFDSPRAVPKYEAGDRKYHQERKPDIVRFDSKKNNEVARNEKTFGNFKVKNEYFGGKNDSVRQNRTSEKRDSKLGQSQVKNYYNKNERSYEGAHDDGSRKPSNFMPSNEKPPRFQKFQQQNQQAPPAQHDVSIQQWSDSSYGRLPQQSDLQLQNSLANLALQQNISVYTNPNSYDHISVPTNGNKNIFYQNVMMPAVQQSDGHRPPPTQSVPVSSYPNRTATAYIQPELKPAAYPGLPNVPDYPFKTNGAIMPGFNEFQASFGSTPRGSNTSYSANNYNSTPNTYNPNNGYNNSSQGNFNNPSYSNTAPNFNNGQPVFNTPPNSYSTQGSVNSFANYTAPPTFISTPQIMQQPPPTVPSLPQPPIIHAPPPPPPAQSGRWKKGQKCVARYWEDQNYYNAIVTAVSENTCVVKFTEYGNYEEVLQDDCLPVPDTLPPARYTRVFDAGLWSLACREENRALKRGQRQAHDRNLMSNNSFAHMTNFSVNH